MELLGFLGAKLLFAAGVALKGTLFFWLMGTILVARLRGARTLRRAAMLGVPIGLVGGLVMGVVALFF
jgi:hypothetical protein